MHWDAGSRQSTGTTISAYFERNRAEYYQRLLAVTQRTEWHEWIIYVLRGVAEQSRDAAERAQRLQDLQAGWRRQLIAQHAPARAMDLADHLFEMPVLTIPRAQKLLGVTYHAAQSNVERSVAAGILRLVGESGQGKTFVSDAIMRAVCE